LDRFGSEAAGTSEQLRRLHDRWSNRVRAESSWTQLEAVPAAVETLVNVLFALLPKAVTDAMHTTMIKANMTAYSTAVGPSSRFKNSVTQVEKLFNIVPSPSEYPGQHRKQMPCLQRSVEN
jgi:hypothetical protein